VIREIRRAHARLAVLLVVIPPVLLGAAWLTRAPEARTTTLPGAVPEGAAPLELGPEFPVQVSAIWDSAAARLRIVARARLPLRAPDAQLSWTSAEPGPGDALPAGSRFLAAVGSSRPVQAAVPAGALARGGRLVLVTHPDRRIAATTPVLLPLPEER
jgi:hypothetical protein